MLCGVNYSGGTSYVDMYATYGSDYDRVKNNNENLKVYYNIQGAGSTGSTVRSSSSTTDTTPGVKSIVKSGRIGHHTASSLSGIYVGSIGATLYTVSTIKIEGGDIFNINGGPRLKWSS